VVRRLRRADGAVDGEVRTDSLAGACAAPVLVAGTLVVAMGEGVLFGIDPDTMNVRFRAATEARLVGSLLADGDRVLAITELGEVIALELPAGQLRRVAKLDITPRTGLVRGRDYLAIGTAEGELVALSAADGSVAFRTPKSRHPASGVVALATRFILAADDGTIRAYDATNGDAEWSHQVGAALAAAPLAQDGLLLIAAGDHAVVLDGESGAVRCDAAARDWLAAPPALAGGRLYVCDRSGALDVFDLTSATRIYRHSLGSPARAQPIVLAEGVLIVTETGTVSIVGS
jgi:outer membrane protein assembly factor BamB